jgi:hypothetical protein
MVRDDLNRKKHAMWAACRAFGLVVVGVFLEITGRSLFCAGINKVLL